MAYPDQFNEDQLSVFDTFEPTQGHFERFKDKLLQTKPKKGIKPLFVLKVAAIVTLLVGSIFWLNSIIKTDINNTVPPSLFVSQEFQEVELFFRQNVQTKVNELINLDCKNFEDQKTIILEELRELDSQYGKLQKELMENPNNERILNAMISSYQLKIDVLNQIIQQVKSNC